MLFSVIIPLYNKADTIKRAIRSVWGQTFTDYELIVVNDGSTDDSLSIVTDLSHEHPIVIVDQTNGGVSAARNKGAEKAQGVYLAFLDADDWWEEKHLEELRGIVIDNNNPTFLADGYYYTRGSELWKTNYKGLIGAANFFKATALILPLNSSSIAIRRDCFIELGGYDTKHSFYEDIELYFKLALKYPRSIYISGNAYSHYMHDAEYSATKEIGHTETPHLDFLESRISNMGSRVEDIVTLFARKYALYKLADNSRRLHPEKNIEFIQKYPNICKTVKFRDIFASRKCMYLSYCFAWLCVIARHLMVRRVVVRAVKDEIKLMGQAIMALSK